ncbi:MAG: hypothetical protein RSF00_10130, partial [Oscillospiraceae bacterium]
TLSKKHNLVTGEGRKKVQIIFKGDIINTFSSCTDVARLVAPFFNRDIEHTRKSISNCCLGRCKSAYGLTFRYAK